MAAVAVDHVVTRDQVVWGFGPEMDPVLEVEPGAVVRFETNDCFTGQIRTAEDLVTGIDLTRINSATGPVAVKGAEPGDSLIVEFLSVEPGPQGVATIIPDTGQLIRNVESPVTQVFRVVDGVIHMNDRVSFPARPMVGVIGVATADGYVGNAFAGQHGGNLDNHLHGAGAKVYFPVRQPGGMFAVGDMHASMGDGEICGTGVEIEGEVVVRFGLVKGKQGTWPVTELRDAWVTHGTAGPDFMEALAHACEEAAKLLVREWGFSMEEAYIFLSVAGDAGICQACQPSVFSTIGRMRVPKIGACPTPFA